MTRWTLCLSSSILILAAGCGPDPIGPRALTEPSPDAARADAPVAPPERDAMAAPDAGTADSVDAPMQRPKPPPPPDTGVGPAGDASADAGVGPAGDAGVDAEASDGAVETVTHRAPVAGELRVDEVLVNPTGQDLGREWIEIVSLAAEPLDLTALHVADPTTDVAAPAGVIAPGARLLLGQVADAGTNGGAPVAAAYGTRLAFNNDGEEIRLCVGACADGAIIARVSWKSLGSGYDGHALAFDHDANVICPATQPFGTAGDFGTPGVPNGSCAAPDAGF
jgi:hypothetical protein